MILANNSFRRYYGLPLYQSPEALRLSTNEYLARDSLFQKYTIEAVTTIFPSTASFRIGKSPIENPCLEKNQYGLELQNNMIQFRNQSQYTDAFHLKFISRTILHREIAHEIEREIVRFAKHLPKACSMSVIANHSQIDIHQKNLEAESEYCSCFLHETALESHMVFATCNEKADKICR